MPPPILPLQERVPPTGPTWITRLALALVTLAALCLRWQGLDFQLPHRVEVDAEIVYEARHASGVSLEPEVHLGTYPRVLPTLLELTTRGLGPVAPSHATMDEHRATASSDVRSMRKLAAILGALAVPATFYLARRLVSDRAALLAATLLALSLLHVSLSQQARPHAPASAFAALAMLACLRMRRVPSLGSALLAGLAVGVTLGTLQNGCTMLLPLFVAWLLRERAPRWHGLAALAAVLAVAAWSYSTSLAATTAGGESLRQGGHQVDLAEFNGAGFARMTLALWSYEPVLLVLAVAGLLLLLRRKPLQGTRARPYAAPDMHVLLAFVLPFVLVNGTFARFDQRFALPLLPYLACLAAFAVEQSWHALRAHAPSATARRILATSGIALLLALPAAAAARLVELRSQPDTILQATRWLEQRLVPGRDRIAVMMAVDLPLFHQERSMVLNDELAPEVNIFPRFTHWYRYQREVQRRHSGSPFPHARWDLVWITPLNVSFERGLVTRLGDERPADYVIIERYPAVRENPGCSGVEHQVRRLGELMATFSCYTDGCKEAMHLEYEGPRPHATLDMTRTLRACERLGPCIQIYRMPRVLRG